MALSATFLSSIHPCPQNGYGKVPDPVKLVYSSLLAGITHILELDNFQFHSYSSFFLAVCFHTVLS